MSHLSFCFLSWILKDFTQVLQSTQIKRTPQDYINEFIIQKLNLLVVVDFRFMSAFLHAIQLRNFYQLSFPEFDVNVFHEI